MLHRNNLCWLLASFVVFELSFSLPSKAQFSLDQSFTPPFNLSVGIDECCAFVAQTYTAGKTGTLAGVSVDVISTSAFRLHVAIRTVAGGLPTTTVLGDVTLSSNASGLSQIIVFPQSIPQVTGVQYAIVVNYAGTPPEGPGQDQGSWLGNTGNGYAGGGLFFSSHGGSSFFSISHDSDLHFRTFVSSTITVQITIKPPAVQPVPINPTARGTIPVGILSTSTFDATTQVDRTSLTFGHTGNEASLAFCNVEDLDGDGRLDLVRHFNGQETGILVGDTVAFLKGKTVSGSQIEGSEEIKTVSH